MLWLATNTIQGLGVYKCTQIGYENSVKNKVTQAGYKNYFKIRFTDGLIYKDDDISGYTSSRPVATKRAIKSSNP